MKVKSSLKKKIAETISFPLQWNCWLYFRRTPSLCSYEIVGNPRRPCLMWLHSEYALESSSVHVVSSVYKSTWKVFSGNNVENRSINKPSSFGVQCVHSFWNGATITWYRKARVFMQNN